PQVLSYVRGALKNPAHPQEGDVELFGLAWKRGVYMASFAIWSLTLEARPEHSTSPSNSTDKYLNYYRYGNI
ncbi:MAG: hypothetical protein ACTSP1_12680, partial [Candidatus Freyarchaeota archaeon]